MQRTLLPALALAGALGLTACSGGGFSTGSLLSGATKAAEPAGIANDPNGRAMHTAATSARATKCGYTFDAGRLRDAFLAAEAKQGLAGPELAKIERTYDFTRLEIAKRIATNEDYCDDARTAELKQALTLVLAGDYTPPVPKQVIVKGPDIPSAVPPMNRDQIFDPQGPNRKGILSGGTN